MSDQVVRQRGNRQCCVGPILSTRSVTRKSIARCTMGRMFLAGGLCLLLGAVGGCGRSAPCVDKSKPELDRCTSSSEELQGQVNDLKRQLAEALANPAAIRVEPAVLTVEGSAGKTAPAPVREGTLSQQDLVATLRQNKGSLQPCYNRALKRDTSLHHRNLKLTLSLKVRPNGTPIDIAIAPNYDAQMADCMSRAIRRWKFPSFKGSPVGVEMPWTFTPKR